MRGESSSKNKISFKQKKRQKVDKEVPKIDYEASADTTMT